MFNRQYENANEAFCDLYTTINSRPVSENGTKKIYNVGIKIMNPYDRDIRVPERNWSPRYAEREWDWYMSKDRSVFELQKHAPIWRNMHGGDGIVNSNYGFLWNEGGQLDAIIEKLKRDPHGRQAWLTIYDGKKHKEFKYDTPCTLNIGFVIENGQLCMTVLMRSNDLWFGFCNDQYCFSKLQTEICRELTIDPGWYYHYAHDMHLYHSHFNKQISL